LLLKTDLLDESLPTLQTEELVESCNAAENQSSRDQQLRSAGVAREAVPPELPAAAILYLSSDGAAFVTGVALSVDGGYTAG